MCSLLIADIPRSGCAAWSAEHRAVQQGERDCRGSGLLLEQGRQGPFFHRFYRCGKGEQFFMLDVELTGVLFLRGGGGVGTGRVPRLSPSPGYGFSLLWGIVGVGTFVFAPSPHSLHLPSGKPNHHGIYHFF